MQMHLVKLVVLGAPGVGKTTLIEHFINDCHSPFLGLQPDSQETSSTALQANIDQAYSITAVVNNVIYQLKIFDTPAIPFFPGSAFSEWTSGSCGLRSAHGYLLVFDLSSPATFQYIKVIRDQLFESRNMQNVPVFVVGNKADLCRGILTALHSHHSLHHHHQLHYHHLDHDTNPAFKDLAQLMRKQWKCTYFECSASFNWHVGPLFKELVKSIESSQFKILEQTSHHRNKDHEHRESIKSTTLATNRIASTSRTSNHTSPRRGIIPATYCSSTHIILTLDPKTAIIQSTDASNSTMLNE